MEIRSVILEAAKAWINQREAFADADERDDWYDNAEWQMDSSDKAIETAVQEFRENPTGKTFRVKVPSGQDGLFP